MITFRESADDLKNIETIQKNMGGASRADAIRMALAHTAHTKSWLRTYLPAPDQAAEIVRTLRQFVVELTVVVRNFYPLHFEGQSAERAAKVEDARRLSDDILRYAQDRFTQLRALGRMAAPLLPDADRQTYEIAARSCMELYAEALDASRDEALPAFDRQIHALRARGLQSLAPIFVSLGCLSDFLDSPYLSEVMSTLRPLNSPSPNPSRPIPPKT